MQGTSASGVTMKRFVSSNVFKLLRKKLTLMKLFWIGNCILFQSLWIKNIAQFHCNEDRLYLEIDKDVVPLCVVECLQMHFEILFSGSVKRKCNI